MPHEGTLSNNDASSTKSSPGQRRNHKHHNKHHNHQQPSPNNIKHSQSASSASSSSHDSHSTPFSSKHPHRKHKHKREPKHSSASPIVVESSVLEEMKMEIDISMTRSRCNSESSLESTTNSISSEPLCQTCLTKSDVDISDIPHRNDAKSPLSSSSTQIGATSNLENESSSPTAPPNTKTSPSSENSTVPTSRSSAGGSSSQRRFLARWRKNANEDFVLSSPHDFRHVTHLNKDSIKGDFSFLPPEILSQISEQTLQEQKLSVDNQSNTVSEIQVETKRPQDWNDTKEPLPVIVLSEETKENVSTENTAPDNASTISTSPEEGTTAHFRSSLEKHQNESSSTISPTHCTENSFLEEKAVSQEKNHQKVFFKEQNEVHYEEQDSPASDSLVRLDLTKKFKSFTISSKENLNSDSNELPQQNVLARGHSAPSLLMILPPPKSSRAHTRTKSYPLPKATPKLKKSNSHDLITSKSSNFPLRAPLRLRQSMQFVTLTAIQDWQARDETELNISKNDSIKIQERDEAGWAFGSIDSNKVGWFPVCVVKGPQDRLYLTIDEEKPDTQSIIKCGGATRSLLTSFFQKRPPPAELAAIHGIDCVEKHHFPAVLTQLLERKSCSNILQKFFEERLQQQHYLAANKQKGYNDTETSITEDDEGQEEEPESSGVPESELLSVTMTLLSPEVIDNVIASFNEKPRKGIALAREMCLLPDNDMYAIATWLHSSIRWLSKAQVGEYLSDRSELLFETITIPITTL